VLELVWIAERSHRRGWEYRLGVILAELGTRLIAKRLENMIGKCSFDSHSLRQPPDFVREPTIMDYFVLDSALRPRRLRGRNNAGCPHNCGSGPECNHAISTAGYSGYEGPLLTLAV
jgi:hypothetical protein